MSSAGNDGSFSHHFWVKAHLGLSDSHRHSNTMIIYQSGSIVLVYHDTYGSIKNRMLKGQKAYSRSGTSGLPDLQFLAKMRPGSILINYFDSVTISNIV